MKKVERRASCTACGWPCRVIETLKPKRVDVPGVGTLCDFEVVKSSECCNVGIKIAKRLALVDNANDKTERVMTFISVSEYARKNGVTLRSGLRVNGDVVISHYSAGKPRGKEKRERSNLVMRLSKQITKESRWVAGDRIDILFDPETRRGLLQRVGDGGCKLIAASKNSFSIQCTWYPGMPTVPRSMACKNAKVTDEGILFDLPDDAAFVKTFKSTGAGAV